MQEFHFGCFLSLFYLIRHATRLFLTERESRLQIQAVSVVTRGFCGVIVAQRVAADEYTFANAAQTKTTYFKVLMKDSTAPWPQMTPVLVLSPVRLNGRDTERDSHFRVYPLHQVSVLLLSTQSCRV